MAAPSRSINYRSGSSLEIDPDEFFAVLRALKQLPKEANKALRADARVIADTIIKPIVIAEILRHAPTVGPTLAQSVRSAGDRIPKVIIGKSRAPYYGNHLEMGMQGPITGKASTKRTKGKKLQASTNMLRYGTIVGVYRRQAGTSDPSGRYKSRGTEVTWPKNVVKPGWTKAASDRYMAPTFAAWESSVQEICQDWLRGKYGR
jgi:hypothetical protein